MPFVPFAVLAAVEDGELARERADNRAEIAESNAARLDELLNSTKGQLGASRRPPLERSARDLTARHPLAEPLSHSRLRPTRELPRVSLPASLQIPRAGLATRHPRRPPSSLLVAPTPTVLVADTRRPRCPSLHTDAANTRVRSLKQFIEEHKIGSRRITLRR